MNGMTHLLALGGEVERVGICHTITRASFMEGGGGGGAKGDISPLPESCPPLGPVNTA